MMSRIFFSIALFGLVLLAPSSFAKKSVQKASPRFNLSTNVRFDSDTVYGKYQYADEALATVEDEKLMTTLLGVRKDFKDRLQLATKKR